MLNDEKKESAITLLIRKSEELGRLPKKSDFADAQVCLIKQKLGPWPRALEAAGLKGRSGMSAAEKSRIKRERSGKIRKQREKALKSLPEKTTEEKTDEQKN